MSELDKWYRKNVGTMQISTDLADIWSFFIRPNNANLQYAAAKLLASAPGFSDEIKLSNYPTEWVTNEKPISRVHHWSNGTMFLIFSSGTKVLKFKTLEVKGVGTLGEQIRGLKEISTLSELFDHLKIRPQTETLNDTEDLLEKLKDACKGDIYMYMYQGPGKEPISNKPKHSGPLYKIRMEPGNYFMFDDTYNNKNKESQMKKGMKPRTGDRLVFTYTNGATYTVRGIVSAEFNKSSMTINYRTKKIGLDGSRIEENVSRPVTNEISTVVFEHAIGVKRALLDLRPKTEKVKEVPKPTRNKRTREEWEVLEAQKIQEAAKQSRIAELQKELAELYK